MKDKVTVVIPAFNEAPFIEQVISGIPSFVQAIIVVNDASDDGTDQIVEKINDPRIILINQDCRQGVGAAVVRGYRKAMELGADITVKVDGDGQMDLNQMERLIHPIQNGLADYTKGVRFRDSEVVSKMPALRLLGNIGLSFLAKVASGYWHIFDPTNGYTAIGKVALNRLNLSKISRGYFLETDMLIHLYRINAVIMDVETETRYGEEISHLSLYKTMLSFPYYLLRALFKRILWRYYITDFSAFSLFFLVGAPLFLFGVLYGGFYWILNGSLSRPTPTGTIMIAVLSIILGFQLILQALVFDINNAPKIPLSSEDKK